VSKRVRKASQKTLSERCVFCIFLLSEVMAAVGLEHLPQDPHSPHFLILSSATVIGAAVICVGRKALGWSGCSFGCTRKSDSRFPRILLCDGDTGPTCFNSELTLAGFL